MVDNCQFLAALFLARQQLRALQLELHPDKQPEDRRVAVQPLFLLVQTAWESQPLESEACDGRGETAATAPTSWDWARRQATAFSAKQHTNTDRSRKNAKAKAEPKAPKAKQTPKPRTGNFTFSTDLDDSDDGGQANELQMGNHWTPESENEDDVMGILDHFHGFLMLFLKMYLNKTIQNPTSKKPLLVIWLGLQGIIPLLASGRFEDAMEAFTSIQLARRTKGLEAEKVNHPWRKKMDRLEAEAWRIYAKEQQQKGFHQFAIAEHLQKAIKLHPDRGELYFDRAMYRVRACCDPDDLSALSRLQEKDFRKVLEDCEAAISRDSRLLDAFDLTLRLQFVHFDLSKVQDLARRGRQSAYAEGDSSRATEFTAWRRCAKVIQRGLQQAQNALSVTWLNFIEFGSTYKLANLAS